MAKRLTMAELNTILTLHKACHSNREIAALLGVNRGQSRVRLAFCTLWTAAEAALWKFCSMPRPPRIDFPDAVYHVASRGNGRAEIFWTDDDRQRFLGQL